MMNKLTVLSLTYDDSKQVYPPTGITFLFLHSIFLSLSLILLLEMSNLKLCNAARDGDYDAVVAAIANGEDVNDFHVSDNDV